ncbi:uncharacterized protein LOC115475996 [Microcaecilia unicolor]|uniref:Uncharacterized protein LOC115475996 n=1 Tax=Microcaecilia unicolor TaxID=1415580 RepID=A0A6P7YSK1_9AMPH|nr:uncharacterized protein LOC115475996 [Microcaecilia unicolor]XP_030067948.1 uncharacterized protein LOC115475996 [Microcaecilia unicolor]XP_030067949.1 uncharacterized protein LOC115475996 [Microcaecilia unicolor]
MEAYKISLYEVCCDMKKSKSEEEYAEQDVSANRTKPDYSIVPGSVELNCEPYCKCGRIPQGVPLPSRPGSQVLLKAKKKVSLEREAPQQQQIETICYCKIIADCQNEKTILGKASEPSSSGNNLARFSSVHDISKLMSETNQFKERVLFFERGVKNSSSCLKSENASRPFDRARNFNDDAVERNNTLENLHCTSVEDEKQLDVAIEIGCKSNPCICQETYFDRMRKILTRRATVLRQNKTGPDLLQINASVASACRTSL